MNLIPKFKIDNQHKCEVCVEAKMNRRSFHSIEQNSEPLELVHSDVCDMNIVQIRGSTKYFVTFSDDNTRFCYVYLLRSKDKVIESFIHYKNKVENQLDKKIKRIKSDRGREYVSQFGEYCSNHEIIHETITPYLPQQNMIAKRKKRTLNEMINAMLTSSGLPHYL